MASTGQVVLGILILIAIVVPFFLGFGALCLLIGFLMWGMKKKTIDQMKLLYEEMLEVAMINAQPNMIHLYRYPAPSFMRLMEKMGEVKDKGTEKVIEELSAIEKKISGQNAVYLGKVIGYNKFDLLATLEGMLMIETTKDKPIEEQTEERKTALQNLIKECGKYLHFIVYEKKIGGFPFGKTIKQGLFAFQDQVTGLESADGIVTVIGEGTQKIGIYFQIVSGYPERVIIHMAHLVETSRIRWSMLLESNIIEVTEKAMNLDTSFLKIAELETVKQAITEKAKKTE